ncbi:MAG: PfkB family carbohydrate kinase, partial [Geminicoccaceae bacterium]|nr:PfkB family carbohydrate kinase [Geminicoccaceae bacterium]
FRERLARRADLLVPNVFELACLSGMAVAGPDDALRAADRLRAHGARAVVATGLPLPDQPARLGMAAADHDGAWLVTAPRHPVILHGTGDVFSALVLGHRLRGRRLDAALERTAAAVTAVVERTIEVGGPELALIAAQDAVVAPTASVRVAPLRPAP